MTLIPSKSAKKLQKSTVKTAKRPILREKCAVPPNEPPKRGRHPNSLANLEKNFTPGEHARELSFKANEIKKVRAAARARLLDIALHKGQLENLFQAGLNGDTEAMAIAEKAAKMVGLDYQASPEASQKIELAGKLDNSLNVKIESVK
jgi:hypothetical protein